MSPIDIIILLCLIPALIQGLRKGFIEQLVALASIFIGAWAAFKFSEAICIRIAPYLEVSHSVLHVIAFSICVIGVVLALFVLGQMVTKMVELVMLGWLNRILGVVFALVKAALLIGLVLIVFNTLNTNFGFVTPEALSDSALYAPMKDFAYSIFPYLKAFLTIN